MLLSASLSPPPPKQQTYLYCFANERILKLEDVLCKSNKGDDAWSGMGVKLVFCNALVVLF